jgi:hypothetical protein
MKAKEATASIEHLYMGAQRSPLRYFIAFASSIAIVAAVEFSPLRLFWWMISGLFAWYFLIGPFLSGFLPFSPVIQEYWRKQRARRKDNPFQPPGFYIAYGAGLAAVGLVEGFFSKRAGLRVAENHRLWCGGL